MKFNFSLFFLFFFLLSSSLVLADNYLPQKVNKQFTFCQTCSNANFIQLNSIQTPNETIYLYQNLSNMGNHEFCFNYTPKSTGVYDLRGLSDGCSKTWKTSFEVTPNGKVATEAQGTMANGIMITFIILGVACIFFGYFFLGKPIIWSWGVVLISFGFGFMYYGLHLADTLSKSVAYNIGASSSTNGAFILVQRGISILPYIVALIILFSVVKLFKNMKKDTNMDDGWDSNSF